MIGVEEQEKLLLNVGKQLKKRITVYAIGGTAMMFLGFKDATLDIDLVFENENDRKVFIDAVESLGYKKMESVRIYGSKKNQPEMFKLGDARFDLFIDEVIHFRFSDKMKERAEKVHEFQNLIIKIADAHDIILMKCATDREKDKDDVRFILENKKVDFDIIIKEAKHQVGLGKETAVMELGEFLEDLKEIVPDKIPQDVLNKLFKIVEKQAEEKIK
ncbi:MAG: DUF6036 family nucleotidyltransferase [archaeon]